MVYADSLLDASNLNPYMRIMLDTGHFTAYGDDVLKFIRENHSKISNLYLKDRLRNHPNPHTYEDSKAFGKGAAHIKEVLRLMKCKKYTFPASIEYECNGEDSAT